MITISDPTFSHFTLVNILPASGAGCGKIPTWVGPKTIKPLFCAVIVGLVFGFGFDGAGPEAII